MSKFLIHQTNSHKSSSAFLRSIAGICFNHIRRLGLNKGVVTTITLYYKKTSNRVILFHINQILLSNLIFMISLTLVLNILSLHAVHCDDAFETSSEDTDSGTNWFYDNIYDPNTDGVIVGFNGPVDDYLYTSYPTWMEVPYNDNKSESEPDAPAPDGNASAEDAAYNSRSDSSSKDDVPSPAADSSTTTLSSSRSSEPIISSITVPFERYLSPKDLMFQSSDPIISPLTYLSNPNDILDTYYKEILCNTFTLEEIISKSFPFVDKLIPNNLWGISDPDLTDRNSAINLYLAKFSADASVTTQEREMSLKSFQAICGLNNLLIINKIPYDQNIEKVAVLYADILIELDKQS